MKKLLIVLLALGSTTAFAHPGDDKNLELVDIGSTLTFLTDVNIPKDGKKLIQNGQFYSFFSQLNSKDAFCNFSKVGYGDKDLVIRAGRSLKVKGYKGEFSWTGGNSLVLETNDPTIDIAIDCARSSKNDHRGNSIRGGVSIGQFKRIMTGVLDLTLADPIEL